MENKENTNPQFIKVKETLIKELESLSTEELHEFFKFFYKMNHNQSNMISVDKFEEFLEAFDSNPFKISEDTGGLRAAYEYSNKALGFEEDIEKLVMEAEEYLKYYS